MMANFLRVLFCGAVTIVGAQLAAEVLTYPDGEAPLSVRQKGMPELDQSTKLGKILTRYYSEGLGGAANWKKIESLRVSGTISIEGDTLEIRAYQKKPNYIKMVLNSNCGQKVTLGYDGEVAWRQLGKNGEPAEMELHEGRRFIHSSNFGNYLLYPFAEGKRIEYVDTLPVDGVICHQIRIALPDGYLVDYFIDIRSYLEVKVVNTDTQTKQVSEVVYEDYIREFGMPIAKKVRNYEEGKLVSTLELTEVKVNTGVMPFMFHMPK